MSAPLSPGSPLPGSPVPGSTVPASPAPVSPASADAPAKPSLTHVAAEGAAWTVINTAVTRVLSFAAQIALFRLLLPDQIGLVGLAQFMLGVVSFMGTLTLTQFLIARQKRIAKYADAAFWLSLALGGVGSLVLAAAAPIAAHIYDDHRLIGLLLYCAVTFPISAAMSVPVALAQIDLRFKLIAIMQTLAMAAQVGASVLAAWLGAGAYSIFIGLTAAAVLRIVLLCWQMRLRFRFRPRFRFRTERVLLFSTSGWLLGVGLFSNIIAGGDYATMGLFFSKVDVGYYVTAFNLAQQAVVLLGVSLGSVLYPAIARLAGDEARQASAVMRAVRMLTLVGAPGGLFFLFLMPPVVHLFGQKYLPAIPIAQIMAAGAVGVLVSGPAMALLTAQERYRLYFFTTAIQTVLFLAFVLAGCLTGSVLGVAAAVSIYFWIGGPLGLLLALDGYRIRAKSVWSVVSAIGRPTLCSLPALLAGLWVYRLLPSDGSFVRDLIQASVAAALFLLVAIPTFFLLMRPACEELLAIGGGVAGRLPGVGRLIARKA